MPSPRSASRSTAKVGPREAHPRAPAPCPNRFMAEPDVGRLHSGRVTAQPSPDRPPAAAYGLQEERDHSAEVGRGRRRHAQSGDGKTGPGTAPLNGRERGIIIRRSRTGVSWAFPHRTFPTGPSAGNRRSGGGFAARSASPMCGSMTCGTLLRAKPCRTVWRCRWCHVRSCIEVSMSRSATLMSATVRSRRRPSGSGRQLPPSWRAIPSRDARRVRVPAGGCRDGAGSWSSAKPIQSLALPCLPWDGRNKPAAADGEPEQRRATPPGQSNHITSAHKSKCDCLGVLRSPNSNLARVPSVTVNPSGRRTTRSSPSSPVNSCR